jgi:lambda repressor-like predicted transcriptional regulator
MAKDSIPRDPLERTLWVQMQLRLKQMNFSTIARELGCHRQEVSMAMRLPLYRQEKAIAEALGVTVRELFPERYDEDGNRIHAVRENSNSGARYRRIAS